MTRRHTRQHSRVIEVIEPSPLTYALGDTGRERLTEIWKDPAMPHPDAIVRHYELKQALEGLVTEDNVLQILASLEVVNRAELDGAVRANTLAISAINDRIDSLFTAVEEVTEQVLAVGTNRVDIPDRVVRFLESHPGVKFSPTSIAENLSIDRADQVCRRLSGTGRISIDNRPGHRPLYFVKGS